MSSQPFETFTTRMEELRDISGAIGLLSWDQETMMPPRGGEARAFQLATLQALYHERLVTPRLRDAMAAIDEATCEPPHRAMLRNLRWEVERAVRVPTALVRTLAEAQSRSVEAWRAARERNDFTLFRPHLEGLVALRREQADALGHDGERYDALLEGYEPGMRAAVLTPLLKRLGEGLTKRLHSIPAAPPSLFDGGEFEPEIQWRLTMELLETMGFDFEAGRQDRSTHPFTGGAGHLGDVRLTNRLDPKNPLSAIMSALHEGGHGLYEQGFDPAFARTSLAGSPSYGLHESQSRFWENAIGRSRPFWEYFGPKLLAAFPARLSGVTPETLYRAATTVAPSLVRTDADEVTYNLHIVIRYELERALLRGELSPADLPEAFRDQMTARLGVTPTTLAEGALQDIHWAWGEFGYFPTYTIGNLYATMLLERVEQSMPQLWEQVGRGELRPLREWLRREIHAKGHLQSAGALMEQVTGHRLEERAFLSYLERKYPEGVIVAP